MARWKIIRSIVWVGILMTACGCGGMAGIGGSSSLSCSAPDGVSCASLSDVYHAARANQLPSQHTASPFAGTQTNEGYAKASIPNNSSSPQQRSTPTSGTPMLTQPRVLRVWFAPWEDGHGILHDQQYVYLNVQNASWNVDHIKERLNEYRPGGNRIFLPTTSQQQDATKADKNPKPQSAGQPQGGVAAPPQQSKSTNQGTSRLMMEPESTSKGN